MTVLYSANAYERPPHSERSGEYQCELKGETVMNIKKTRNANELKIAVAGRLDTQTAPQLDAELRSSLDGVTSLVFDLKELEYISSAGLRVLLSAQKRMNIQGKMKVTNAGEDILEIFEVTGFSEILTLNESGSEHVCRR